MVACDRDRLQNLLRLGASDGADFIDSETLDGVQNESFAMSSLDTAQGGRDQTDHFIRPYDLLGSGDAPVGDDGFSRDGFVRLMELQFSLIASFDIAFARGIFEVHGAAVGVIGAGKLVEGFHRQMVEPGLERKALRL
jgi:hypothetical protein